MNQTDVIIECLELDWRTLSPTLTVVLQGVKLTFLRSKSFMCRILEMGLTRNFAADLSLQIFNNHYISR